MKIVLENIHKSYGKRAIVNRVNVSVAQGEIVGLLGPNGAGKTTTINILCNLLTADSGAIAINNQPISEATKLLIGIAHKRIYFIKL